MKRVYMLIGVLLVMAMLIFSGCATGGDLVTSSASPTPSSSASADGELVLSLDELAKYNGKDGNPAYIAVDGVIYDVSNVRQWKDGEHNGYFTGTDLTDEIKNISPHGVSKLKDIPVVGKLAD